MSPIAPRSSEPHPIFTRNTGLFIVSTNVVNNLRTVLARHFRAKKLKTLPTFIDYDSQDARIMGLRNNLN